MCAPASGSASMAWKSATLRHWGVVDHTASVEAGVEVGRDEPGQVPHDLVGGAVEQIDEFLLPLGFHG